jgi:mevalonate pyrophosphate decarboxylase
VLRQVELITTSTAGRARSTVSRAGRCASKSAGRALYADAKHHQDQEKVPYKGEGSLSSRLE